MNAIDTNVLVRALIEEDPKQAALVNTLFRGGAVVWIAKTVLLEASWVLRGVYGFTDASISRAFAKVQALSNVQIEDGSNVAAALVLIDSGLQFADALHLCSRPPEAKFVTFDKRLVGRATRVGILRVAGL